MCTTKPLGNNTGEIALRCNVTNPKDALGSPSPGWGLLEVSYEDTDNFFNAAEVVVTLRRVDKFTGSSFKLAEFISNGNGLGKQCKSEAFAHNFDFVNNAYDVGISVKRTNATQNPNVWRVRLYPVPVG